MAGWGLVIWPALFGLAYGGAYVLRRTISPVASIIVGNLVFYAGSAVALVLLIGSILLGLWSMGSNGQIALLLVIGGGFCSWLVYIATRTLRQVLHDVSP